MKTTIELPDELFRRAKAIAAERRITLKSMIEHALRRELSYGDENSEEDKWVTNQFGFPVLKSDNPGSVSSDQIYTLLEEEG